MSPALSLMVTLLAFAIGCVVGRALTNCRALPPSTARQLRRAARANRLDLRKPEPRWNPLAEFPDNEETR